MMYVSLISVTTGTTDEAETAKHSRAPEANPVDIGVRVAQY